MMLLTLIFILPGCIFLFSPVKFNCIVLTNIAYTEGLLENSSEKKMHSLLFGGSVGSDAHRLLYGTIFTFLPLFGIFRWLNSILFYSHFINRKYRFSIPDLLLYWLSSLAACRQTYTNLTFLFLNMECCRLSKFGDTTVARTSRSSCSGNALSACLADSQWMTLTQVPQQSTF